MELKFSLTVVICLCSSQIASSVEPSKQSSIEALRIPTITFDSTQEYLYDPAGSPENGFLVFVRMPSGNLLGGRAKSLPDFANPQSPGELAEMLEEQRGLPNARLNRWAGRIAPGFAFVKGYKPEVKNLNANTSQL